MRQDCLEVSTIGYSTLESIPTFHYDPGHPVLRLIVPPKTTVPIIFFNDFLDELNRSPGTYSTESVRLEELLRLVKRWDVRTIFFDGIEPMKDDVMEAVEFFKKEGIHVGIRTQGFSDVDQLKLADFIIFDVSPEGFKDVDSKIRVYKLLEELTMLDIHVEVVIHMTKESPPLIVPIINNVKRREIPLHIKVYEPRGLGYEPFLRLTKRSLDYVYVHAGGFSMLDTRCPRCGNYVAVRERGILVRLEVDERLRCPRCRNPLYFRGDISKSTPKRVIRETRGEVVWYHLRALPLTRSC